MGFVKSYRKSSRMSGRRRILRRRNADRVLGDETGDRGQVAAAPFETRKPADRHGFCRRLPRTNFDVVYKESALFLRVVYDGDEGGYCLSMPVTSDMAMAGGREFLGFPKKMADIHFKRDGRSVEGWTERRGVRFVHIRASLTGKLNDPAAQEILTEP